MLAIVTLALPVSVVPKSPKLIRPVIFMTHIVLLGAAECLRRCFKDVGEVYRLGGDEFCVITTKMKEDVTKLLLQMEQMAAN